MEDIHTAMISLSKYYRLILNKGQDTLTLSEELQHVGYYIKIQDIRFPGKLTFVEEVDRELLPSIVPKIILQPLVENAIQHGIWEKPEKRGTIRIWGYEESGIACIKVIDDGIGMDANTLMFGEAYGLSYESREGEGTCVTVRFPKTDKSGRPGTAAQREE